MDAWWGGSCESGSERSRDKRSESETKWFKSSSGPAPTDKRPLTIIIKEAVIEKAKIEVIRQKTNVSRAAQELLQGWLSGQHKLQRKWGVRAKSEAVANWFIYTMRREPEIS